MTARPWLKFFPADWRADPALRVCSLAARGLWLEMLAIMHEAEPRGHLLVKGRAVTVPQIAALVGSTADECGTLLAELEDAGVFDRRKNGVIVSRRMERDENRSRKARENGKLGGNPKLCETTEKPKSLNLDDKPKKPEARSQKKPNGFYKPPPNGGSSSDKIEQAFETWNVMAERAGLPVVKQRTQARRGQLAARLKQAGPEQWAEAVATVERTPFLCGGNERGWRAGFDFLVSERGFAKVIEGQYRTSVRDPPAKKKPMSARLSDLADKPISELFDDPTRDP